MGWPEMAWNGRKMKKIPMTHGGCRRRFLDQISTRPAAVDREILRPRSSSGGVPPCLARVQ